MTFNLANIFLTPQTGSGTPVSGDSTPLLGSNTGVFAATPGLNFMDLILSNAITAENGNESAENSDDSLLSEFSLKDPEQKEFPHTNLLHKLLTHKLSHGENSKIDENAVDYASVGNLIDSIVPASKTKTDIAVEEKNTDIPVSTEAGDIPNIETNNDVITEESAPVLNDSGRQNFFAFIENLLKGIPEESRPLITKIQPGFLRKAIQDLRFTPKTDETADTATPLTDSTNVIPSIEISDNAPSPDLIATGLTPESLTKFIDELRERTDKGESFIVGLVKILPPQAEREAIFLPRAIILPRQKLPAGDFDTSNASLPQETEATNDQILPETNIADDNAGIISPTLPLQDIENIKAQLNALTVGGDNGNTRPGAMIPAERSTGFEQVLKVLELAQQQGSERTQGNPSPAGLEKALNNATTQNSQNAQHSAGLSTFAGHFAAASGLDFSSGLWSSIYPDGMDWGNMNAGIVSHNMTSMTLNGPGMMTSLVNHSSHAAQPHPATQMVAATISKSATDGQKNITVRLDPPDLGRVEIRMEFNKDKHLKVHLAIEKNETFLMLQRDAHVLERTLQDTGLEMDGNGLSFELAEDGGLFDHNHDGNSRGGGGSDGPGANNEDDIEIIESRMDWYVDPDTGLTRYDLLV